jgi:aerotaxis receptor
MAVRASQSVAANAPVLGRSANAMVVRAGQASQTITGMAGELQRVRRGILELRFGIGLCRLHNDMVTSFINEVAAGQAPPEGLSYVPLLCRALHRDVVSLTSDMANSSRVLRSASEQIEQANEQLREFQRGMATWRLLVPRYRMSRQLDPYVAPIDRQLNEGHTQMAGLRQIASRCSAEAQPFDPGEMNWAIDQIRQVSARFPAASPA